MTKMRSLRSMLLVGCACLMTSHVLLAATPSAMPLDDAEAVVRRAPACLRDEPSCEGRVLAAAEALEAANRSMVALPARRALVAHLGPDRPGSGVHWYQIGTTLSGTAIFDEAAAAFEASARVDPSAKTSPAALLEATRLRLALGQVPQADLDVAAFVRTYATSDPQHAALLQYSMALHFAEVADWTSVVARLRGSLASIDRGGAIWLRMAAHGLQGKALVAKHDPQAGAEFHVVQELEAKLAKPTSDSDFREYGRALIALGDALVFDADAARDAVTASSPPAYAGAETRAAIDAWIASRLVPWISARSTALQPVETRYGAVTTIQPVPPPGPVIIAANRVFAMWSDSLDAVRHITPPFGPNKKYFAEAVAKAAAPLELHAKSVARTCMAYAVKLQDPTAEAGACVAWLEKSYPHEYVGFDGVAMPLVAGGSPVPGDPLPRHVE